MSFDDKQYSDVALDRRVLHVIYSMKQGGAERLLLDDVVAKENMSAAGAAIPGMVICWHHEGVLAKQLRLHGVPYTVLNRRLRPIWKLPLFLADLRRLVREIRDIAVRHNAPVIHGHLIDSLLLAVLAARRTPAKSVGTIYSNHVIPMSIQAHSFKRVVWEKLARWSLRHADRVISISAEVTQTLIKTFNVPKDNIAELPVTIEPVQLQLTASEAKAKLEVPPDALCLVFVGRLVENKNQACLVRVVAELTRRAIPAHLVLVGEGPDQIQLSQLTQELGLEDRVHLLGHFEDLPAVLAAADMFVTASKSEGVSLALLEAMSAEVPVISTSNEGNRELLKNGVGTLVPQTSDEALADAIADLWQNDAARKKQVTVAKAFFDNYRQAAIDTQGSNAVYRALLNRDAVG